MAAKLFRLVWTRENKTLMGEPTDRDEALRQFDNCSEIRRACSLGRGSLRVMREQDYQECKESLR